MATEPTEGSEPGGRGLGPWIFASAVILVGGVFTLVVALPALRDRSSKKTIERMIAQERTAEAVEASRALRARHPDDPELLALLERAVDADLDRYVIAGRYADAYAALDRYEQDLSYLPDLAGRRLEIQKKEIDAQSVEHPYEALQAAQALLEKRPDDAALMLYVARVALRPGAQADPRWILDLYQGVLEKDESLIENDADLDEVCKRVLSRSIADKRLEPRRSWIAGHRFEALEPWLLESVYDPKNKNLRRNIWYLFQERGETDKLDQLRFFTLELVQMGASDTRFSKHVFAYFEPMISDGVPPAVRDRLGMVRELEAPDSPFGLQGFTEISQQAHRVIEKVFADELREDLLRWCTGESNARRVHAFQIAQAKGWVTPDLELDYHLTNIASYDQVTAPDWLLQSVRALGTVKDRKRAATAAEGLQSIVQNAKRMEKHWEDAGSPREAERHRTLRLAAERALGQLS